MKITKLLHPGDTMTAEERLQAAINLQVPDRMPPMPSPKDISWSAGWPAC